MRSAHLVEPNTMEAKAAWSVATCGAGFFGEEQCRKAGSEPVAVASPRASASEPALRVASARPERSGEPVSTCGGRFGARLPVRAGRSGRCAGLTSPPGAGWGEWKIASVFRCRGDRAALHHCRGPPRFRRTGTRGSADPVHIVFGHIRQLKIDHMRHPRRRQCRGQRYRRRQAHRVGRRESR
jgi:hypothetical protein